MQTVVNINVDEIDPQFIERLKRDFAHSDVEIRLGEPLGQSLSFSETDFWDVIDRLDWSQEQDDEKVVEPLVAFLAAGPIAHIYRFSDLLAEKLWHLDTSAHAKVFLDDPEEAGYLSVDDFLYTRCAVVANGRAYYENVLNNPVQMPADLTFEPLLYVALKAYKRKTGKDFTPVCAFNYETYSNKEGWKNQNQGK
jgi:hypothetical protein